jgi:hypothetical protein
MKEVGVDARYVIARETARTTEACATPPSSHVGLGFCTLQRLV